MKTCNRCKKQKSKSEFHKNKSNPDGLFYTCKICRNREQSIVRMKKYNNDLEYKLKVDNYNKSKQKERLKKDPLYHVKTSMKNRYNLSFKDYNTLLKKQNNRCAICNEKEKTVLNGKTKRLHIDHCHKSGKIRGLLCNNCNLGIGYLKENKQIFINSIKYLEKQD